MNLQPLADWFMGLGAKYNVNPIIFGSIYVGAIPFFSASVTWLVRNYRKGKSVLLPTFLTGFFFVSDYLYLIVVGKNVPVWVYGFVVALVLFGAFSTFRKIKLRLAEETPSGA